MEKELIITNNIEELSSLVPFVEEICDELNLGPDLVFNLNLVLEEAMTNVVMYAYPQGETHNIWLTATCDGRKLTFVLKDEGKPFDPTEVPEADVTLGAEERPIGGLGIFLIRNIMDEVSYQYVGSTNVLTMTKGV